MMIIRTFLCLFILGVSSCSSHSAPFISPLGEALSYTAIDIISAPEAVIFYRISPQKSSSENLFCGYSIVNNKGALPSSLVKRLAGYMADDKNFYFAPLKKVRFLPEYGFLFIKGNKSVAVLASPLTSQIEFFYGDLNARANNDISSDLLAPILTSIENASIL